MRKRRYISIYNRVFLLVVMLCNITTIAAQIENHNVRSGNNYYRGRDYDRAEKNIGLPFQRIRLLFRKL